MVPTSRLHILSLPEQLQASSLRETSQIMERGESIDSFKRKRGVEWGESYLFGELMCSQALSSWEFTHNGECIGKCLSRGTKLRQRLQIA